MSIELHESNKSYFFSPIKAYLNEKKDYYNTTIKKKKFFNKTDPKSQYLLINLLKHFSVKYELEEKYKSYKFVLSFDELISLIRYSLQTQMKLNKIITDESEHLKIFSQDFINNLTYYIYSFEKVEIDSNRKGTKTKFRSPSNKENYSMNSSGGKNNKIIRIIKKRSNYWSDTHKLYNNQYIKEDNQNNQAILKKQNSQNINNDMQTSMSYSRRSNESKIFSPEKNKEKNKKTFINRSVERRHNSLMSNLTTNNKENSTKKKLNINTEKSKELKDIKNKNENKSLSIFKACENLKSCSFILKNKKREVNSTEQNNKNTNYSTNYNFYHNTKKQTHKTIYYNKNMNLGVKKKILTNNVPRPSNLANKLLLNGRKYIIEFNGIKEEEKKKQYY